MGIYARHDNEWYRVDEGGSAGLQWGDFTTNGDETTSNTWGPDADGRMWKWAEWNEAKDYTVNLTGGIYHVLTVNGGNTYKTNNGGGEHNGRPGDIFEGYWEFTANNATPITVGKAGGPGALTASNAAGGSSIGGYGSQTWGSRWGDASSGMGSQNPGTTGANGYKSFIRGVEGEFSTAVQGAAVPGRAGTASVAARPGCVIIATAAPNAKALNWVHTTYHAEVNDGTVTAVYTQKHYADGKTTPLPTGELVEASYGVGEGWLFVNGELQPPPTPPEPTRDELIAELQARIVELQNDTK